MTLPALHNGWTGGQYSLFRALLGFYLFVHFIQLLPWGTELFSAQGVIPEAAQSPLIYLFPNLLLLSDAPIVVMGLLSSAALAALSLSVGYYDRTAAIWIWICLACLLGRNPLISNPSMPYVGWMLLAHSCLQAAPYGSFSSRNRTDPSGAWQFEPRIFAAAWIVLALSYTYSGYTKLLSPSWLAGDTIGFVLENPLARLSPIRDLFLLLPPIFISIITWIVLYVELFFAPACLIARLRPFFWLAMLIVQIGFLFLLNFADLTFGMILFHLLTFDPGWIRGRNSTKKDTLFFDGTCALCHGCVRFMLSEDRTGLLAFSPLQGATFRELISREGVDQLPDSMVLQTEGDQILFKSQAILYLLKRLGGLWTLIGSILSLFPKRVGDAVYDFIGARRFSWFGKTPDLCPIIPNSYRDRFLH